MSETLLRVSSVFFVLACIGNVAVHDWTRAAMDSLLAFLVWDYAATTRRTDA